MSMMCILEHQKGRFFPNLRYFTKNRPIKLGIQMYLTPANLTFGSYDKIFGVQKLHKRRQKEATLLIQLDWRGAKNQGVQ